MRQHTTTVAKPDREAAPAPAPSAADTPEDRQAQHITDTVGRYRAAQAPITDDQRTRSRHHTIIRRPRFSISILPTACEWCGSDLVARPRGGYGCRIHEELFQEAAPGELQILSALDLTEAERAELDEEVRTALADLSSQRPA